MVQSTQDSSSWTGGGGEAICGIIELALIPGLGPITLDRLWKAYQDPLMVFSADRSELESRLVPASACDAIRSRSYRGMAREILDWCRREGCQILVRGSDDYPPLLGEIADPPLVLYWRGRLELLSHPAIAIVGTRRPTPYGIQMAEGLAHDLAERGVVIASGLARGIDAAAHRGCLLAGGPTIAVLGCGIDIVYPPEHRRLNRQILDTGVLVSEFPPGTAPSPQNFPVRNRIISGLALGTLIVEASEYSGSLITARLAMEQGRDVFAVPGNITAAQSFGPNFLIKEGAKLVQSWRDIAEELPSEIRHRILSKDCTTRRAREALEMLSERELTLLSLLEVDRATMFDQLYRRLGGEISEFSKLLLELEIRGYVRQLPGGLYVRLARPGPKN